MPSKAHPVARLQVHALLRGSGLPSSLRAPAGVRTRERAGAHVRFKISNTHLPPSSAPDSNRCTPTLLRGRPSRDTGILKRGGGERVKCQSQGPAAGWRGGARGRTWAARDSGHLRITCERLEAALVGALLSSPVHRDGVVPPALNGAVT